MDPATILLAATVLVAFTAAGVAVTGRRRPHRLVVVTTTRGESYRGRARAGVRTVRLSDVEALHEVRAPTRLAGELDIHRRSIELVQRLPAVSAFRNTETSTGRATSRGKAAADA